MSDGPLAPDRRRFLIAALAAPAAFALHPYLFRHDDAEAAEAAFIAAASDPKASPTPECGDDDEPTPSETAGPFFKPRSPERKSLFEKGMKGTQLDLSGRVFGRDCKPIAGALLDFWQADNDGEYDLDGFRLRGHQFADAQGRYRLVTVVPGLYPGRTRHIHVRVQPKGGSILTTQLYVPGERRNRTDGLFDNRLLMAFDEDSTPRRARFHFRLETPQANS